MFLFARSSGEQSRQRCCARTSAIRNSGAENVGRERRLRGNGCEYAQEADIFARKLSEIGLAFSETSGKFNFLSRSDRRGFRPNRPPKCRLLSIKFRWNSPVF
jgi:hypothetical protein